MRDDTIEMARGINMVQNILVKKTVIFSVIILLIGAQALLVSADGPTIVNGSIIYVDDDNTEGPWYGTIEHPYQTIQDGILHACAGDTVFVFSGLYHSSMSYGFVSIQEDITLEGEDPQTTIIQGGGVYGEKWVVGISSEEGSPKISNFTIENSGTDIHDAGILVNANNVIITNNIIKNNQLGIYFSYTKHQYGAIISGNTIEDNKDGIFMWDASDSIIYANIIQNNVFDGVEIIYSSNNNVVMRNTITGHTFDGESEGVLLKESTGNLISENNIYDNRIDAYFENAFFNKWGSNYWGESRIFPKLIVGRKYLGGGPMEPGFPLILLKLDWHPAIESHEIIQNPIAVMNTTLGTMKLILYEDKVPITTNNFVRLSNDGFFDDLVFHRVIEDFVIQGGGYDSSGSHHESPYGTIDLEIHPDVRHVDGAISMARTSDPNSATSQFFICDGKQVYLDDEYAAFGRILIGMDVLKTIASVETTTKHGMQDWPVEEVIINSVAIAQ